MSIIPPAILPASAQLLLAIGPQGEIGGIPALESRFSELLDAEIGAGLLGLAGEKSLAPTSGKAPSDIPARQTGKLPGKPTGKTLPGHPQFSAPTAITKGEDILPPDEAIVPVAADGKTDLPRPADAAPVPLPVADSTAIIAIAVASGPNLPAATDPDAPPPRALTSPAPAQLAPPSPQANAPPETLPIALPTLGRKLLAKVTEAPPPAPTPNPALPNRPEILIAPAAIPASSPQAIQPAPVARSILAALGLNRNAKPAPVTPAEPQPASEAPAPSALNPMPLPVQTAPGGLVAAPRQFTMQPDGKTRDTAPAPTKAVGLPSGHPVSPIAAPQTVPAVLELAPPQPPNQGVLPAAVPTITAPAATPAPHDFAALIDRLVEARQTAQSSLAVQTVTAAVTHAEFGQVSLQFRQDADGLSVVMASADPELARAVQVASPAAQTGSNDNHAAPRQDSSGQPQTQAQNQAHSQQQRGQSPQHRADDPRGSANPSPRQRRQEDSPARGGIFA